MRPNTAFSIGLVATLASAVLWHGPGGAGERFASRTERDAQAMLRYFEMDLVTARVQRDPLARRIIYAGPADDFQRTELVRLGESLPGIGEARWSPARSMLTYPLPLAAEAVALALAAFLLGLTFAAIAFYARREPV